MEMKTYDHVQFRDIYNDGVMREVIVMKEDDYTKDLFFIQVDDLDDIDVERLRVILKKRDADKYPLWDLLSNVTLKNGVNALEFFHQLVKQRMANGKVLPPGKGFSSPSIRPRQQPQKRGPGRPPKGS